MFKIHPRAQIGRDIVSVSISTCLATCFLSVSPASAQTNNQIGAVFYIDMENHNWTQPSTDTSAPSQISGNPAAPYINSLVTPGQPNAAQVSYCSAYHNVLARKHGAPNIHPSEPNYIWQEAGSNLGILNDNDPYASVAPSVPAILTFLATHTKVSGQHLTGLLQNAGISWKAYQEDIDLLNTDGGNTNQGGTPTNVPVAPKARTVPLVTFSGTATTYTNPYNGSNEYSFACKHDGTLFFVDTNGGDDPTSSNKETPHYLPLQQLFTDLDKNTVGRYNLITPDEYNDMHSSLTNGFTYLGVHYTGDQSAIAAGDNFLATVIPKIMASKAYKNNGVIVIWWDETVGNAGLDNFKHTLGEIVISELAKGNAYNSTKFYTHSSDLNTLQKIFQLTASTPTGYLNDAANPSPDGTLDLSDLFQPGVIPTTIPPI
jgi:phosphatidylinositol-3-phosphatase